VWLSKDQQAAGAGGAGYILVQYWLHHTNTVIACLLKNRNDIALFKSIITSSLY